ncbi:MotA/TolQ/ExbB proton channel family protein [Verrucomicrobiales bacterium]|nr:MotA/TolQ/ExbB proton channel family protein [Verrucomicrobiales bacterium]MDC0311723.1 MotA/TolQ/ExbB proton channel family protein [bacterium]
MSRFVLILISLGLVGVFPAFAQENTAPKDSATRYQAASDSVDADLKAALDELAEVRKKIAVEKPEISKEANRIAAELRESRRQAEIATTRKDSVESEFENTEANLKTWRDEKIYLEGLFADFQKNFDVDADPKQSSLDALKQVEETLSRLESGGSVAVNSEKALGPEGVLIEGKIANSGPVSWFLSTDEKTSGIVTKDGDGQSRIVPNTSDTAAIRALINRESASPAFDPTLGNAVAMSETEESILEHIKQGGFWIIPILILALVGLIAAIAKWIQLLKIRSFKSTTVQQVIDGINNREFDKARSAADSIKHPAGAILEQGITSFEESPDSTRDDLEEKLFERFLEAQPPLQRGLPLIAIASATAPLLGLLGTVTGMIETFRLINIFGTGDARTLASGISEALVTTEFGLIVAIPALILHALLSRKITGIKASMEMTSLAFLNGVKLKGDIAS